MADKRRIEWYKFPKLLSRIHFPRSVYLFSFMIQAELFTHGLASGWCSLTRIRRPNKYLFPTIRAAVTRDYHSVGLIDIDDTFLGNLYWLA
jgi:hypothetical protein